MTIPPLHTSFDEGATWDSGLEWDFYGAPSLGDIVPYLNLVTSEHADKPNFITMLSIMLQPLADDIYISDSLSALFDFETATGTQLDTLGLWIGESRDVTVALTGVYFSFDTDGVGFDQGTWLGPFDPTTGLEVLPDDSYRTLLRGRIAQNQWDGTLGGAYDAWNNLFGMTGTTLLIQDFNNLHILFALYGPVLDAVTIALFKAGSLTLKPAGVLVDSYILPSVGSTPYFGFDVESSVIAGFDVGAWGLLFPGM